MQLTRDDVRRVLAGKEVLGVLAGLLLVSGLTTDPVFVEAAAWMAAALADLAPAIGAHVEVAIFAGLYLQALVLATVYRGCRGVYVTLQRRRQRVLSA